MPSTPSSVRQVLESMCRGPSLSTLSPLSLMRCALAHTVSSSTQSSSSPGRRMQLTTLLVATTPVIHIVPLWICYRSGSCASATADMFDSNYVCGMQLERRLLIYAWIVCASWQTIALGCRDSWCSMLLVVVLALDLVHCCWSASQLITARSLSLGSPFILPHRYDLSKRRLA